LAEDISILDILYHHGMVLPSFTSSTFIKTRKTYLPTTKKKKNIARFIPTMSNNAIYLKNIIIINLIMNSRIDFTIYNFTDSISGIMYHKINRMEENEMNSAAVNAAAHTYSHICSLSSTTQNHFGNGGFSTTVIQTFPSIPCPPNPSFP
jgi:hypothetical protein